MKAFLRLVIDNAILDRESFLDAIANTNDEALIKETSGDIARIKAISGLTLRAALAADPETVRLAALYAECWFEGLADAQAGKKERADAAAKLAKIRKFRMSQFGRTQMEQMVAEAAGRSPL